MEYLAGVARWALAMSACRDAVAFSALNALALDKWAELKLDEQACAWVHEFVADTKRALNTVERLTTQVEAWSVVVEKQPSIVLDALIVYEEFMLTVVDAVLQDRTYYEWWQEKAKDGPEIVGRVTGAIMGFLAFQMLWMWVGGWVGRLGILGKVLWEIVEAPLPSLPSEKSDPERAAGSSRSGARVPTQDIRKRVDELLGMLGEDGVRLMDAISTAAREAQGSFTARITDKRLRRMVEVLIENPALLHARRTVVNAVNAGLANAKYAFGSHSHMTAWGEHINKGVKTVAYVDLIGDGAKSIDDATAVIESIALMDRIVESAHAIDQKHWAKAKAIFQRAGFKWRASTTSTRCCCRPRRIAVTRYVRSLRRRRHQRGRVGHIHRDRKPHRRAESAHRVGAEAEGRQARLVLSR